MPLGFDVAAFVELFGDEFLPELRIVLFGDELLPVVLFGDALLFLLRFVRLGEV